MDNEARGPNEGGDFESGTMLSTNDGLAVVFESESDGLPASNV